MTRLKPLVSSVIVFAAGLAAPALSESRVEGTLTVDGNPVKISSVYAHAEKGFFDEKKQDVVVLMCDAPVPEDAVRDRSARAELVKAGKLHCVEQTIDSDKQVINYKVQHSRFGMPESGGSTFHVFEAKTFDGKTIAGRSRTTSPQKSFDDVPYSYDITFDSPIEPMK
jgi:hypothetical protein